MWLGYRLCLAMKLAALIVTMSVASLCNVRAQDASIGNLQPAQAGPSKVEHQPAGACTPIGLTANGDIVFPWECREIIEKQRGPISISLPNPSNQPASHAQSPPPSPDAHKQDAVATAAAVQPKADETMSGSALPPEVNETSALAKPARRASDMGRSKLGRKGQHADALRPHQGSNGPVNAKKKDRVALQPAAAQK
jgi:hypothetical protein